MAVLGEDMVKDGYLNVISVDNSAACFDQLNLRYKGNKDVIGLTCECTTLSREHLSYMSIISNLCCNFFM